MSIDLYRTVLWWYNGHGQAKRDGGTPLALHVKPDLGIEYEELDYNPGLHHMVIRHFAQAITEMSREEVQMVIRFLRTIL